MSDPNSAVWSQAALAYLDALYGYAIALTHNPVEAEDLVQDTYAQAICHHRQLYDASNLKGWLFTILRNIWLKQRRHARSGPQFVALDAATAEHWPDETTPDPPTQYVRIWEREEIRSALERLPQDCREIIILRDIEDFSYKEIADILGCPLGTIMSRLARSRSKLRRLLSESEPSLSQQRGAG